MPSNLISLWVFLALFPSWHWTSGCRAKRSVSEAGHPLGMVLGTNTAAAFPLLYPSVGFGPLLGPQHRSCQASANTLVQQPDYFRQDFSVSTDFSN